MTRFARAKGSKASNERVFENATSWGEMKKQLLDKQNEIEEEKNRRKAEEVRNSNYQKFLNEREEKIASQTEWADFPNAKVSEKSKNIKKNKNGKKTMKGISPAENDDSGIDTNNSDSKKSKNKTLEPVIQNGAENSDDEAPAEVSSKVEPELPKVKKAKLKKKLLKIEVDQEAKIEEEKKLSDGDNETTEVNSKSEKKKDKKGLQNEGNDDENKQKSKEKDLSESDKNKLLKKQEKRKKQLEKKKLKKQENKELVKAQNGNDERNNSEDKKFAETDEPNRKIERNPQFNKNKNEVKVPLKKAKSKDGEYKRRKDFQPTKMIINGNEVELEYFEGYPIRKEDAENLKKLRKDMIIKGLPRSEINRTMKLERRKAEKALAREKKKVCFNCRKFGHNLSECQELNRDNRELVDTSGTGICFKCGSTEHTSFVCKVVQGQSFKFATCFICKEQGHISRQCPDNARGLYPKGGSCKICGDVTHLKKDCPQFQAEQEREQQKFQVETFGGGNPEDMDNEDSFKNVIPTVKQNKIIKF